MILPDLNLLLYAYNPDAAEHAAARAWWEATVRSGAPVGIPWIVIVGFVRLSTSRNVLRNPITPADAMVRVAAWFAQPNVTPVNPGERHLAIFGQTLTATVGGNLTTDAHLAALAIEHQAELQTTDLDFSRFTGLRWRNPLAAASGKPNS
jgi:uncharacterized protein